MIASASISTFLRLWASTTTMANSSPPLRPANLGDVGADATKALEAAGGIDDRVAGDRNPARAARRVQFHLEIVERRLFQQDPAELGMAAKQRRQGMAEERARRPVQEGGHAGGDVGDAVVGIHLPQPAHTALLIF